MIDAVLSGIGLGVVLVALTWGIYRALRLVEGLAGRLLDWRERGR